MDDLDEIYQTHADEVKRFLICLTSNVDLAEELTQETFYEAVQSIHRYNGKCKMSVWLCQIAKHRFYDYLKKKKRYRQSSIEAMVGKGEDLLAAVDPPDVEVARRATLISIYKEIHALQEPYREIFLLRTSTDLRFKEIGEVFGKSENWARVTYYRAKLKLAERIQGDEDEL